MTFPEVILESWHRSAQLARSENPCAGTIRASVHVNAEAFIALTKHKWQSGPYAFIPLPDDDPNGRFGIFGPIDVYRVPQWDWDTEPRALLRVAA